MRTRLPPPAREVRQHPLDVRARAADHPTAREKEDAIARPSATLRRYALDTLPRALLARRAKWNCRRARLPPQPTQRPLENERHALLNSNVPRTRSLQGRTWNHKNCRRARWLPAPRHTASMFLSPVRFALRTLPLR